MLSRTHRWPQFLLPTYSGWTVSPLAPKSPSWASDSTSNCLLDMDASQVPKTEHIPAHLHQLNSLSFPHSPNLLFWISGSSVNTLASQKLSCTFDAAFLLAKGVHQAPCPHSLVWFTRSLVDFLVSFLSSPISSPCPSSLAKQNYMQFSHSSMPVHLLFPPSASYTFYLCIHPLRCNLNATSSVHTEMASTLQEEGERKLHK